MRLVVILSTMLLVAGCGSDGAGPPAVDATPVDTGTSEQWVVLAEKAWSLPPGSETMDNAVATLTEDMYVRAIRPIGPPGTHHTLVNVNGNGAPGTNPDGLIFASGVNTEALYMPPGVGLKLKAGDQINAQLHLYNVGEDTLTGTSGVEVLLADAADIQQLADIQLDGPLGLNIPPGEHTVSGNCTVSTAQTVFAVFPHMHQLGTHLRTSVTTAAGETVLHDDAYNFDEQRIVPVTPVTLAAGDTVHTSCTYNNTTGANVSWGQSSDDEMCFSIIFRYPAGGSSGFCGN